MADQYILSPEEEEIAQKNARKRMKLMDELRSGRSGDSEYDFPKKNYSESDSSKEVTILRGGKEPESKSFSKGGSVSRGDGRASRGRTKGRFI